MWTPPSASTECGARPAPQCGKLVSMTLDPVQVRVLGALMEKEIATPENCPLSLNALVNACNQRTSRDPVLGLTEDQVRQALHALEDIGLTAVVREGRVPKYENRIRTVLNLRRDETALLCLLFLRGPQTPGELRARADRLHSFDGLEAVESTLARMTSVPEATGNEVTDGTKGVRPLAVVLPRQPGSREARFAHLLGGPVASFEQGKSRVHDSNSASLHPRDSSAVEVASDSAAKSATIDPVTIARISALEAEVAALQIEVAALRAAVAQLEASLSVAEKPGV